MTAEEMYIGIDVGKAWLYVAIWGLEGTKRVSNDENGLEELAKFLENINTTLIAVEASGGYEQGAVQWMILRGYRVAVVNPHTGTLISQGNGIVS